MAVAAADCCFAWAENQEKQLDQAVAFALAAR